MGEGRRMSGPNRLLAMFESEVHQGKHKAVHTDHSSMAPCDGGAAAFVGTRRSESKLERENGRLREQLKFQGAVLDQLAGDVHILERKAATTTNPPVSPHHQEVGIQPCGNEIATSSPSNRSVASRTQPALALPSPRSEERDEGERLRSALKDARAMAECLRTEVASVRQTAEESGQAHVQLLSRERKFRAAVEAGLREKVHSIRRRARDREERLSAELSFVKKQLKEAIDLLATKEEEVSAARAQKSEQDERAAAALARLKERDRHATWLERRLAEVSSGEAAAATLCTEEMTASLVSQQRELELLRAGMRRQEQVGQQKSPPPCERCGEYREDCGGVEKTLAASRELGVSGGGISRGGERSFNGKGGDTRPPTLHVERSCPKVQEEGPKGDAAPAANKQPSIADGPSLNRNDKSLPATRETIKLFDHKCVGPDEGQRAASTLDGVPVNHASYGIDGSPGVQTSASPGALEATRAEASRQLLELLLSPGDQSTRASGTPPQVHPCVCDDRRVLQSVRSGISAALTGKTSTVAVSRGGGAQDDGEALRGESREIDEQARERRQREGVWEARAAALEGELAKMQAEAEGWEKETVALRVERQAVFRRLRRLEHETDEKNRAVLDLENAATTSASELAEFIEARRRLQRELSQQVQARRVLETRARSAEASLAESEASRAKSERAKALLKARLTAATRRDKSAGADTACRLRDGSTHDKTTTKARARSGGDGGTCREEEGRGGGADRGRQVSEVEAELDVVKTSLSASVVHVKKIELQLQAAREAEDSADRDRKQSRGALLQAEARAQELERAWEVLAAKVVSLADRNADLEWAILKLQRDQSTNSPPRATSLPRMPPSSALSTHGDRTTSSADDPGVPRASLDLDAVEVLRHSGGGAGGVQDMVGSAAEEGGDAADGCAIQEGVLASV